MPTYDLNLILASYSNIFVILDALANIQLVDLWIFCVSQSNSCSCLVKLRQPCCLVNMPMVRWIRHDRMSSYITSAHSSGVNCLSPSINFAWLKLRSSINLPRLKLSYVSLGNLNFTGLVINVAIFFCENTPSRNDRMILLVSL